MVFGCKDSCRCRRCELRFRPLAQTPRYSHDRTSSEVGRQLIPGYGQEKLKGMQDEKQDREEVEEQRQRATAEQEASVQEEVKEPQEETIKGVYQTMRTTNQDYGMWLLDPNLRNRDWYKVKRFPLKSSCMSRFYHESLTGVHT